MLWQREYPSRTYEQHRDNCYATATPAVDAEGVVVTWTTPEQVVLLALDLDGGEVWRRDFGPFVAESGCSGISPILYEDLVVLANDQDDLSWIPGHENDPPGPAGKSSLIAVDRQTGQTRWQIQRPTSMAGFGTPCVYQAEDGRRELIFTSTAPRHDRASIRKRAASTGNSTRNCATAPSARPSWDPAWCLPDRVSASGEYAASPCGQVRKNGRPRSPTKSSRPFRWSRRRWSRTAGCFSGPTTGSSRASKPHPEKSSGASESAGSFYGSPVWVNGRLYCIAKNGDVVVLAAADKFELLSRVPLGELSYATPAVAGGVMYLRTQSQLFSLGGKEVTASGRPGRRHRGLVLSGRPAAWLAQERQALAALRFQPGAPLEPAVRRVLHSAERTSVAAGVPERFDQAGRMGPQAAQAASCRWARWSSASKGATYRSFPAWQKTRYYSDPATFERADRLLDEFLETHGERLINDPLKRAFLQRDLWAVFDHLVGQNIARFNDPDLAGRRLAIIPDYQVNTFQGHAGSRARTGRTPGRPGTHRASRDPLPETGRHHQAAGVAEVRDRSLAGQLRGGDPLRPFRRAARVRSPARLSPARPADPA